MDGNCYTLDLNNTEKTLYIFIIQSSEIITLLLTHTIPLLFHFITRVQVLNQCTHLRKRPLDTITASLFKSKFSLFIFIIERVVTVRSLSPPLCVKMEQHSGHLVYFYKGRITLQPCCLSCQKTKQNHQETPLKEIIIGRKKINDRKEERMRKHIFLCLSKRHE